MMYKETHCSNMYAKEYFFSYKNKIKHDSKAQKVLRLNSKFVLRSMFNMQLRLFMNFLKKRTTSIHTL